LDWWILESVITAMLIVIMLVLGPLIKRFGRSYAADVFRGNPRTGKSYMVLMDIAYYLIFTAYILFTANFEPNTGWASTVNAAQIEGSLVRLGGMLLVMGVLHGLNVLSLPVIGRLLGLGRELVQSAAPPPAEGHQGRDPASPTP
jgi:hypothetical protein